MTDRLDDLLASLPDEAPVPPGLNDAVLAQVSEPRARRRPVGSLVAAVLLAGLLGAGIATTVRPAPPTLVLASGSQLVTGSARVVAADRVVQVEGRALISVEPASDLPRGEGQEADAMNTTHLVAALAGSLVTVAVYEGTALISGEDDAPALVVAAGEQRAVGSPPPPRREVRVRSAPAESPPLGEGRLAAEDAEAVITALQDEIARLEARQALTTGQLAAVRGEPQPWPDDVPEAFRPAAFERSMRTIVEEEGAGDLLVVDCAEFPCLTVLRPGPYEGQGTPPEVQAVIDRMQELLGASGVSVHNAKTGDGTRELLLTGLGFAPEGSKGDEGLQTRAAYRMEGHLQGLSEELMGEPQTEDIDVEE